MSVLSQPRQLDNGYFIQSEEIKDFVDFLFDVKNIGDFSQLWSEFLEHDNIPEPPKTKQ